MICFLIFRFKILKKYFDLLLLFFFVDNVSNFTISIKINEKKRTRNKTIIFIDLLRVYFDGK